jgi:hypothetical protein
MSTRLLSIFIDCSSTIIAAPSSDWVFGPLKKDRAATRKVFKRSTNNGFQSPIVWPLGDTGLIRRFKIWTSRRLKPSYMPWCPTWLTLMCNRS